MFTFIFKYFSTFKHQRRADEFQMPKLRKCSALAKIVRFAVLLSADTGNFNRRSMFNILFCNRRYSWLDTSFTSFRNEASFAGSYCLQLYYNFVFLFGLTIRNASANKSIYAIWADGSKFIICSLFMFGYRLD